VNDDLRIQEPGIDPWPSRTDMHIRTARRYSRETPTHKKEDPMEGSMTLAQALRTPECRTYLQGLIREALADDEELIDEIAEAASNAVSEASRPAPLSPHQLQEAAREADPFGTEPAWVTRMKQLGGDPAHYGYRPPEAA
jgi:hypothetical protein